jgi:phage-related protein
MEGPHRLKRIIWIGSSRKDLKSFPDDVKDLMGYALYQAQRGGKALSAKPLTDFGGAGILEIVADHRTDTYRAVYTVKFGDSCMFCMLFKRSRSEVSLLQRLK